MFVLFQRPNVSSYIQTWKDQDYRDFISTKGAHMLHLVGWWRSFTLDVFAMLKFWNKYIFGIKQLFICYICPIH